MRWTEGRRRLRGTALCGIFTSCLCLNFCLCVANSQQTPPAPPAPPPSANLPPPPLPPPNQPSVQPAFSVVIDAAHGGSDTGARFGEGLLEKDIALSLSVRLRSSLAARGISVLTTRESDAGLPFDQRAGVANHALASACLLLHATATGSGVHLFTSSLAPTVSNSPASLLPWDTAQSAWITRSLRLSSEINSALGKAGIPATLGSTSLRPLDNLACPAVAIEIAALAATSSAKTLPVSDARLQKQVLDALISAVLEWRTDWKQQP